MATTAQSPTLMDKVKGLIDQGQFEQVVHLINRGGQRPPEMENALGVCLLRLGKAEAALNVLRSLAFENGSVSMLPDTPAIYKVNFVTAAILTGNVSIGFSLLDQIHDEDNPAVIRIRAAIKRWKESCTPTQRFLMHFSVYPDKPIDLERPIGEL